jgi:hypothetical protein
MDLWAFEEDLDLPDDMDEPVIQETPRSFGKDIPVPRERQVSASREPEDRTVPKTPAGGEDQIRMNVNKARLKSRPAGPTTGQSKPESDFDELEEWEDAKVEPDIEELPAEVESELIELPSQPEVVTDLEATPPTLPVVEETTVQQVITDDEFSPVIRENATPVPLVPHLKLSKIERIGLIALAVLLLLGATTILIYSLSRLPTEAKRADAKDFPIKGSHLSITSATSYWRAPITEGPNPDTFRRETQLLPVLEIGMSGGPAAIRVLFRNDEHAVIGDAVTRAVTSGGVLKIPATAGFDDLGMHAAYRTGESRPWTIEVYEAPSEGAAGRDFKKLFEMNISTDRR